MRKEYLIFGQPKIDDDCINKVVETLRSNWIGTGPRVKEFEELFKKYKDSAFAIALNSCTAGLHLALCSLGIKPGDDVLVPTMTFCATVNTIEHVGARPVFLDCDSSMNINLEEIKKRITPHTKAIIGVHFAGRCISDIEAIAQYAKERNIYLIEDCAHAIESEINNKKAGCFGDISSFSFYATKNITTAEGGMIITNNPQIADRIKTLALHGMSKDAWKRFSDDGYKHYEVEQPGFKYNMTDIAAAIGVVQLSKINAYYKQRARIWKKYQSSLSDLPIILPEEPKANEIHAYHLFPILIDTRKLTITRDQLITLMHKENIGTGVHYRAVHLQPFYQKKYNLTAEDFPVANYISNRTMSLPFSQYLTEEDTDDVIMTLKKVLAAHMKKTPLLVAQ